MVKPDVGRGGVLQLELVGHDFFVFRSVKHRRAERRLPAQRRRVRPDRAAEPLSLFRRRRSRCTSGSSARAGSSHRPTHRAAAARGRLVAERADAAPATFGGRAQRLQRRSEWRCGLTATAPDLGRRHARLRRRRGRLGPHGAPVPTGSLESLCAAVEDRLEVHPPDRAHAVRKSETLWAVSARRSSSSS